MRPKQQNKPKTKISKNFFVVTKKINNTEVSYMPTFFVTRKKPKKSSKFSELLPGEYTHVGKCEYVPEYSEIVVKIYEVANDDGKIVRTHLETFTMEKL